MKYRSEVDGLRALAVIPVILFHAGFELFSGGFVGVDVFFVISGYLITTIILSDLEQGTFSLVNFYERRARRILPALFLVMLVSLPFAWMWLLPADLTSFSKSLVAVSFFVSNIFFLHEGGYWGVANELKPLLHTWSLAVEEQFYVLFPLFLMLMWRVSKRWMLVCFVLIAIISLIASQRWAYSEPEATFFLLTTRSWELAIGACIAFYFLHRKKTSRKLETHRFIVESLNLLGLLMIGYAVFAFDEATPFPSIYALLPTIGTGLIVLFSSQQTLVGRLLGTKVLVGIGLISYSAYLWHYPLLAFARHRSLTEPGSLQLAILAALTFPLAYLSWRYVEQFFRKKKGVSRKAIFRFALAGSLAFILIGLVGQRTNGFEGRNSSSRPAPQSLAEKLQVNHGLSEVCDGSMRFLPDCRTSDEPEILVWGDSFAMHLVQGIIASNPGVKLIQSAKSVCGPFFDIAPVKLPGYPANWASECLLFTATLREWLQTNSTVKYAVISSNFDNYLSENTALLFRSGELADANAKLVIQEFEKTLGELKTMGITPIVFSPAPANGSDLGRCLARASWTGLDLDVCNFQADKILQNLVDVYSFLEDIDPEYRVVRLDEIVCEYTLCNTHIGSTFLYRDKQHFSHEGSAKLGKVSDFYRMITDSHSKSIPDSSTNPDRP